MPRIATNDHLRSSTIVTPALALAIGGSLYLLARSETLLLFKWLGYCPLVGSLIIQTREIALTPLHKIPSWMIYSLPAGLWLFSGSAILGLIWHRERTGTMLIWMLGLFVIAIGSELGQLAGFIPGTYGHADLLTYIVFFLVAIVFVIWWSKYQ